MILVLWRQGPDDPGFRDWQDLLITLAVFALPLRLVICGQAAAALRHPDMQDRLAQLREFDLQDIAVLGGAPETEPDLPGIDGQTLAQWCQHCSHLVHC
jgi:hypothetical protein